MAELLCCSDDEKIVVGAGASTINSLRRHKKNSDVEQKEKGDTIEAVMRLCPALRSAFSLILLFDAFVDALGV